MTDFHTLPITDIYTLLKTSHNGLSDDQALERRETHGANLLDSQAGVNPWLLLLGQFKNVLVVNLAIVAEIALLAAILYIPVLQKVFGTYGFTAREWVIVLLTGASILPVVECAKLFANRCSGRLARRGRKGGS